MSSLSYLRSIPTAALLFVGCAHGSTATVTTTSASTQATQPLSTERPNTDHAHALVIQAASCWLGGLWSDALGEVGDARDAGIARRCHALLETAGEPESAYYPLRALDPATTRRLAARAGGLGALLQSVADASRENMHARRAADQVKEAYESSTADERRANKIAAAPALRSSRSLHALLSYGGPYATDARTVGLLLAVDRMEIARGLPKHLKIYAVEGALSDVFGEQAPLLSGVPEQPIPTGTWLAYLTRVARAAGHPVPADARNPSNREPLAWNGVLQGLADRLRELHPDPALDHVAQNVVARIDRQATTLRRAFDSHTPENR
jgi:hypothetical protein